MYSLTVAIAFVCGFVARSVSG